MTTTTQHPAARGTVAEDPGRADRTPIPEFLAGDIILFAGKGDAYSRVSRWLMRTVGEGPTYAVHTAQFLDGRRVLEMDVVGRIKSFDDVLHNRVRLDTWQRRGFEVWRCRSLTAAQRAAITRQALTYVNAKFGPAKMFTHLLDGLLNKVIGRDVFFFRRFNHADRYPLCCWITVFAYDRAIHYQFGVPPDCADPDHIHDWVSRHPEEWVRVLRLAEFT
jgi:hypothetical protein